MFRTDSSDFWSETVGRCFFEPHGINRAHGLNYRDGLPYLIVNGAIQTSGKSVRVEYA